MSEGNRFVVEVVGRLQEAHEVTVSRVSSALGLDEARAAALVARMPGVITKPAGEDRAMKIALRLQEAGVPALHRPLAEHEDPFKTAERPIRVAAPEPAPVAAPEPAPVAAPEPAAAASAAPTPRPDAPALVTEEPPVSPAAPQLALEPEPEPPVVPRDVPSLDATHHDGERDPKLTPMTEAGFGAADIVIPTTAPSDRSRPRATFVEAGSTAAPAMDPDDPARTMVRPPSDQPTPAPGGTPLPEVALRAGGDAPGERPLTPVGPVLAAKPAARGAAPGGARKDADAGARSAAPAYRQTRSAAEPPLTLSAPPEDVLKRSGVPEPELPSQSLRRRGRFGRHLAAQVALPGLLTWSLTAVALWWFLGSDRSELFVVLAAATAVAALIGSLIAALGTIGVSRDVLRLRDEARRIAMGELTAPVGSNRDDELGEIAGSLERMRLSLQEGLERLRKRTKA